MAATTITYEFSWENGVQFKMQRQKSGEDADIITLNDEQGSFGSIWPNIEATCKDVISVDLTDIGNEMKQ